MKNVVSVKHFHTNQPEGFRPEICNRSSWSRQWRDSRRLDSSRVKSKSEKYRGGSALINHCHSMTELKNGSSVRILVLRQAFYLILFSFVQGLKEFTNFSDTFWNIPLSFECYSSHCIGDSTQCSTLWGAFYIFSSWCEDLVILSVEELQNFDFTLEPSQGAAHSSQGIEWQAPRGDWP